MFDTANVGFLSGKSDAGAGINTELDHLKSVINEKLTEVSVALPFFFRFDREVEADH